MLIFEFLSGVTYSDNRESRIIFFSCRECKIPNTLTSADLDLYVSSIVQTRLPNYSNNYNDYHFF